MRFDYVVGKNDHLRRAGRIAAQVFHLSQHDLAVIKRENSLFADAKTIRLIDRLSAGTVLSVIIPDTFKPNGSHFPYTVYEDDTFQVIDKPAGLPTMASSNPDRITLESLYTKYYDDFRPVNRLDKGTGGLMVCAKNGYYQHILSEQLHTDSFIREYLAVAEGRFDSDDGMINLPIAHSPDASNLRCIHPHGKPSVTYYRRIMENKDKTLLRLRLITGRTHQIRIHLAAIGHPICGDYLYGSPLPETSGVFALQSAYLFLTHPITKEKLFFRSDPTPRFKQYYE